eukprot:gnl/Dysnectes_brevis/899_a996_2951.p1 GENE.gnl/Dysnectes_brevis/899_a996_2951~~gnl/Dysnectes_brevis/899_a996_2951.p1  ORF type:complete len:550 (+),score=289.77 gnl/Dysnectes_brevis/899_a996_2951:81-1730(+)
MSEQPETIITPEQPAEKQLSKKQLKKLEKARQKAALKEERRKAREAQEAKEAAERMKKLELSEVRDAIFGDSPVHKSQDVIVHPGRVLVDLSEIEAHSGEHVWIRARMHNVRGTGKSAFMVLRQKMTTLQGSCFAQDVPEGMIRYLRSISRESVVEIYGLVKAVEAEVKTCSIKHHEIQIERAICVSRSQPTLPLQVEDAMRPDSAYEEEDKHYVKPGRETRLNYRYIDLRTPANQAIFRVRARIARAFRDTLTDEGFTEIHSPKIIGGASEGGSAVFHTDYFGQPACLAQSPQLYKQMAIASGMERVFEIGPVFRAEKSHTHRHLCEFVGLDLEMEIKEHYHEVLQVLSKLMVSIFEAVFENCSKELTVIASQFDVSGRPALRWLPAAETPIIRFDAGIQMLKDTGMEISDMEDLTTEQERKLGEIVLEKYGTDFYILDKFPMSVRPFYTMPDPVDGRWSNSYDMFIRGEEITSGAQRIHDRAYLEEMCRAKDMDPETISDYAASFMYGCPPHGGAGIGLERVVMLLLGIKDCRQTCLFPRTPERLAP